MAKTKITDVIVPDVFNPYIVERTAERSALINSGIVQNSPELNTLAQQGGRIINMPFWDDLDGDDEVLSDSSSLTPAGITANQDKAVLYMRGKAWSVNDLAAKLSGDDPMAQIGNLVIDYWERRRQALLVATLNGVFASASMSDNLLDISGESAGAAVIDADAIVDLLQLLGDRKNRLTAYMMHSKVEALLVKQQLIDYIPDADGNPTLPTYLGKRVIVDDNTPLGGAGEYFTFAFGAGAFGYGAGEAPVPTETDRDTLSGDDILVNRHHFILHPRGVKWTDNTVSGASPTNAEVETAANWSRVYDPKNIRIVALKHRIASA